LDIVAAGADHIEVDCEPSYARSTAVSRPAHRGTRTGSTSPAGHRSIRSASCICVLLLG